MQYGDLIIEVKNEKTTTDFTDDCRGDGPSD